MFSNGKGNGNANGIGKSYQGRGNPHVNEGEGVPGKGVPSLFGGIPPGLLMDKDVSQGGVPGLLGGIPPGFKFRMIDHDPGDPDLDPDPAGFGYDLPDNIFAGIDAEVSVTFKLDEESESYENVRFYFKAEGDGDVTFTAEDSEGTEHTFTNEGYWGPSDGFDLGAEYESTTVWTLTFSAAGNYDITFSLIDAETEDLIADFSDAAQVDVKNAVESLSLEQNEGILKATAIYSEGLSDVDEAWKVDVWIESNEKIPAGSEIMISYQGGEYGSVTLSEETDKIWLSQLIADAFEEGDYRTSLAGHEGQEIFFELEVELPEGELTTEISATIMASNDDFSHKMVELAGLTEEIIF